jgi:hypothetical protein
MSAQPLNPTSTSSDTPPPPARGAEMRSFLQSRLQKNRAPPLVHAWDFWHDRQDRSSSTPNSATTYEDRLVLLAPVPTIASFWSLFNNFPLSSLPLRDTIHLFKHTILPTWESPRNRSGGAWTFRVPKDPAPEFWKEVCMMAIGETLQAAVEEKGFKDDICGVSLGVRYGSCLVQVWNRDGGHEQGVQRVLEAVLGGVSEGLRPREGSYYYKRHAEHAAFGKGVGRELEGAEADAGVV